MTWYEKAEALRADDNDDSILRWNTCARMLNDSTHIVARGAEQMEPSIGE
jgi:hypothetical protein